MTAIATPAGEQPSARGVVFRLVAGLCAGLLLASYGVGLLAPWFDLSDYRGMGYQAAIHRWHDAQSGGLVGVLLAGSLLGLLWRPRAQPLLLQFVALVTVGMAAAGAQLAPRGPALLAALAALCVAIYPAPRELLHITRPRSWSPLLLGLSALAAALLGP